jgi:hypothetical protein
MSNWALEAVERAAMERARKELMANIDRNFTFMGLNAFQIALLRAAWIKATNNMPVPESSKDFTPEQKAALESEMRNQLGAF